MSNLHLPALTPEAMQLLGGEEAIKAVLSAGDPVAGIDGINKDGNVPENLEMTAHVELWRREHLQFLRQIPSVPAVSINHEYDVVTEYGDIGGPIFTAEGTLGAKESMKVKRVINTIRTLQHVNQVTGTAQDQPTVGILRAKRTLESNREAVMRLHLLKKGLSVLFSDDRATGSTLRFKGVLQLWEEAMSSASFSDQPKSLDPRIYVDKRGKPLSRSDIRAAGTTVYEDGWGMMNQVFMDPQTSEGFQGEIENLGSSYGFPMERLDGAKSPGSGLILGQTVAGIRHQGGVARFFVDNSLAPQFHKGLWSREIRPGTPAQAAAPVPTFRAVGHADAVGSRWEAADIPAADGIKYKVQAINDQGYAEASVASGAVAGLSGNVPGSAVSLSITTRADALSYRILRNTADAPNKYWEIAELKNDAATLTFVDKNWQIPGSRIALGMEMLNPKSGDKRLPGNPYDNAIRLAVLRELTAKRMADIGDFEWERILERFCPEVPQPKRLVVFYNIGQRS